MQNLWSRRAILQTMGAGVAGALTASSVSAESPKADNHKIKGNIKQSICRWCYRDIPLEKLAAEAVKIGYKSIELLMPDEYKVIKPFGLTCAMIRCKSIPDGLNRKENHDQIEKELRRGARAQGFGTDLWTLPRVGKVIEHLTGVHYHPGHVWRILGAMDWSLQRPARQARERNPEKVKLWLTERWPAVKKTLVDEKHGFSLKTRVVSRSVPRSGEPGPRKGKRRS